jgi:outer membrane protein assembly factor BamB
MPSAVNSGGDTKLKRGFLWSAPVVSDEIVYFGPFGRHVYAVDAQNGTLLWRYASEYDVSFLTLADGVVYVLTESGPLRTLDAGSGALLWSCEADDATGIALEDGVAYVVTRENLLALDAATGELLSRYESDVKCTAQLWSMELYMSIRWKALSPR